MLYSDLNSSSPKQTPLVFDMDSIYQSILNILCTKKGERMFLPTFGSDLDDLLFEIISEDNAYDIYNHFTAIISQWEPRVTIDTKNSKVVLDPDNNSYDVTIVFQVNGFPANYQIQVTASKLGVTTQ